MTPVDSTSASGAGNSSPGPGRVQSWVELSGTISPDRPLLVVATEAEATRLPTDAAILLTGMGKVNATAALTTVLAAGSLPAEVINLGTAGALRPGLTGLHLVRRVVQHDLDTELLHRLTGETVGAPLDLGDTGLVLATGDTFVSDEVVRERLARRADLVDMEGYAVASVAIRFGVPVRLVKCVSDGAGDDAARSWQENVAACAALLAGWLHAERPTVPVQRGTSDH